MKKLALGMVFLLASCEFAGIRWTWNAGVYRTEGDRDLRTNFNDRVWNGESDSTTVGVWFSGEPAVQKVEVISTPKTEPQKQEREAPKAERKEPPPQPNPTVIPPVVVLKDGGTTVQKADEVNIGGQIAEGAKGAKEAGWWGLAWLIPILIAAVLGIYFWRRKRNGSN